nr:6-carboxytetrahydropterin synthase [Ardenticatena sp.]
MKFFSQSSNGTKKEVNEPTLPEGFWDIDIERVLRAPKGFVYEITLDMFFNARHFVVMNGVRGDIHTHSYRLQVRCRSRQLEQDSHVVVGYTAIRERMKQVVSAYNNQLLNDLPPFQQLQPTTENLTAVIFQQLERLLADLPVELVGVTVWESPTESVAFGLEPAERETEQSAEMQRSFPLLSSRTRQRLYTRFRAQQKISLKTSIQSEDLDDASHATRAG